MKGPKKSKRVKLDVYNETENQPADLKYIKRRGGGGGQIGRTMDEMDISDLDQKVSKSDDEELSDEEAFNSEEDTHFSKIGKVEVNMEEDEDISVDENDYIDLSDLLNEDVVTAPTTSVKLESIPESKEEDPSESEAESEFKGVEYQSSSDNEKQFSDSDDEEIELDEQKLESILRVDGKHGKPKRINERTEGGVESEFKVPNLHKKVQLGDLVEPIAQEKNFAELKTHLSVLDKVDAVQAPLAPRIQASIDRIPARVETEKSVSRFTPLVRKERESDSLRFNDSNPFKFNLSSNALVGKYQPFTEMEVEINQLLESSGLTEKKQKEYEELELNKLSKEELIAKRAELSKMRSLMFYNEKKQRKIAKIKSKVYRKIHKKHAENGKQLSLEELEKLSPEQAKEEKDRLEFERAKERMTLKHKNTGKWARQMLGRSDHAETQKALMEQLQRGDELLKKIKGTDDSDDENIVLYDDPRKQGIHELEQHGNDAEQLPNTGIFGMKFMQRGFEAQKHQADKDILKAQRELQGIDSDEEDTVVRNGILTFKHNPNALEELGLKKIKEEVAATKVFEVPSFESVTINEDNIAITVDPKSEGIDISELKWIDDNPNSLVKKSVKPLHEQFARSDKTVKALTKIANKKKEILQEGTFQQGKIIIPEFQESEKPESKAALMDVTNDVNELDRSDIMQMAFANDNIEAEFNKEKEANAQEETCELIETSVPGWGSWVGPGIKHKTKTRVVKKPDGIEKNSRKDKNLKNVIINEKRQKKAAKYLMNRLPHGYESREQYERTLSTPLGKEWNTHIAHTNLTKPKVVIKPGVKIMPLKLK